MTKLITVLTMLISAGAPLVIPGHSLLNKNLDSSTNYNFSSDTDKIDLSKLEMPVYQISDFDGITDDVLYEYLISTAAGQEENKNAENFLNNLLSYEDSNWFIVKKINFKVPTEPNQSILACVIVNATNDCPLYFGTKTISFNLTIPEIPIRDKNLNHLQFYVNRDMSGFATIDYQIKNDNLRIAQQIDNQLKSQETGVFGVSGILNLMWTQNALTVEKRLNFEPYNPNQDENKRNDFVSDYTYIFTAKNGWEGQLAIQHMMIQEQKLEDFNSWKNAAGGFNVRGTGSVSTAWKIYQNNGDWNEKTYNLVWNAFAQLEYSSGSINGYYMFGDKTGQLFSDDFLEKYHRFFHLNFEMLSSHPDEKYSQYQVTIGFNWDYDIPFANINKDSNNELEFTVDLTYDL